MKFNYLKNRYYYIGLLKGKNFFVAKFCHIAKEKGVTTFTKDFLEKIPHIHHILKGEKSFHLDHRFLHVPLYNGVSKIYTCFFDM
jgi:hypothetical protein